MCLLESVYYEIIKFDRIYQGNSGPQKPIQKAISNRDEVVAVLRNIPFPSIDFSTEEVIVVGIGRQPTDGFKVEITSLTYLTDRGGDLPPALMVTYTMRTARGSSDIVTDPVDVVRLKKLEGIVQFTRK